MHTHASTDFKIQFLFLKEGKDWGRAIEPFADNITSPISGRNLSGYLEPLWHITWHIRAYQGLQQGLLENGFLGLVTGVSRSGDVKWSLRIWKFLADAVNAALKTMLRKLGPNETSMELVTSYQMPEYLALRCVQNYDLYSLASMLFKAEKERLARLISHWK